MKHKNPIKPGIQNATRSGILAVGLLLISVPALANDYSPYGMMNRLNPVETPGGQNLQFIGNITGQWESNPLMLINNNQKSLWGAVISPELVWSNKTPTSLLKADITVDRNQFNQESFNSTDVHGKFDLNHSIQRWAAGAQIGVDYDTSRTSELFPIGLNGSLQTTAVRHLGLSFAPNIAYSPNVTDQVKLTGTFADSQYEKTFGNFVTASVTPSYSHQFDQRNSGIFSVTAQRYQTTSGPKTYTDTIGPSIGWHGVLSPQVEANANVGVQGTKQHGSGTNQNWNVNYTFSGDVAYHTMQDKLDFQMTRNNYPFGNGTEALLTGFTLTEQHNINARFAVNVGASYQFGTYQSDATGNLNYLVTGTGGLTYHATERLDVAATYQYRRETLLNTSGNAHDHLATIGLVYRPQAWKL